MTQQTPQFVRLQEMLAVQQIQDCDQNQIADLTKQQLVWHVNYRLMYCPCCWTHTWTRGHDVNVLTLVLFSLYYSFCRLFWIHLLVITRVNVSVLFHNSLAHHSSLTRIILAQSRRTRTRRSRNLLKPQMRNIVSYGEGMASKGYIPQYKWPFENRHRICRAVWSQSSLRTFHNTKSGKANKMTVW